MDKISLANLPTPIQKLEIISKETNKNIYIKRDDLTDMVASGNKIRKLEYAIKDAINKGCDLFITCGGFQSNHARATAAVAAQLHMKCVLLLREELNDDSNNGNYFLDQLLGATIIMKKHDDFKEHKEEYLQQIAKDYQQQGYHPYIIPMGASNGVGTLGYIEAYQEILDYEKNNHISFDAIVCAVGSGGTYAGLYIGNELAHAKKDIIGFNVCDDEDYFKKEIHSIIQDTLPLIHIDAIDENHIHIIDGYVGKGYSLSQQSELDQIVDLSQKEGIILDPVYTGKAYQGLLTEIEKGTFDHYQNILFIHTGGLFGLLAKMHEFNI